MFTKPLYGQREGKADFLKAVGLAMDRVEIAQKYAPEYDERKIPDEMTGTLIN